MIRNVVLKTSAGNFSLPKFQQKYFSTNKFIVVLLQITDFLFTGALYLTLFLLPFLALFNGNLLNEASLLTYASPLIIVLTTALSIKVLFLKSKALVDSPGFLGVLIFAFLTTFSSILVSNSSYSTFGTFDIKAISGLATLFFVFTFIFIIKQAKSIKDIKKMLFTLITGLLGFFLYGIFFEVNNYEVVPSIIVALTLLLISYRLFPLSITILLVIASKDTVDEQLWLSIFTAGFASSLLLFLVSILKTPRNILEVFSKNARGKYYSLIVFILPIFFLAGILQTLDRYEVLDNPISESYTQLENSFNILDKRGLREVLFGVGSGDESTGVRNIFERNSTSTNVLRSYGIVGLAGYLALFVTAIAIVSKNLLNHINNDKGLRSYAGAFFFITTFITILALFVNVSLLTIWISWIILSLSSVLLSLSQAKDDNVQISTKNELSFKNKNLEALYSTAAVVIIAVGLILIYGVLTNIDLIN